MADSQVLKALLPDNPLCGIDTNKDTLNLATGACTRYVKKLVFNGTENWRKSNNGYFFVENAPADYSNQTLNVVNTMWTHFVGVANAGNGNKLNNGEACFYGTQTPSVIYKETYIRYNDASTADDFKAFLAQQYAAGTPVTVWYVLAEPTTETIPVPSGLSGTEEGYLTQSGTPSPSAPIYPTANMVNVWQHSLWEMKSATETIQSGDTIYANGQPITTYTLKGNEEHTGTPSPQNPVMPQGTGDKTANLLDYKVLFSNSFVKETASFKYYRIAVTANTQYTLKSNAPASVENAVTTFLYGRSDTMSTANDGLYTDVAKTITSTDDGYVYIAVRKAGTSTAIPSVSETDFDNGTYTIMLNEGSTPLPYEPYGFKIPISSGGVTTPMYLTEPLMKIGDTVDSLASSGTVTYNIGWIDLGTLDWEILASGNFHSTTIITDMKLVDNFTKNNAICTDFEEVTPSYVGSTDYSFSSCLNAQRTPFVNKTGFEGMTAAQFKAAMSGVIMYYVKATATTESVTAPTIPTTEGANSITVDTTVQPSEFTATWTGWHDASVQEYVGGGVNKFNKDRTDGITDNYYINQQGTEVYNVSYYISYPITVGANKSYTWQFGGTIGHNAPTVAYYDSSNNLISVATHTAGTYFSFTTPSNCAYIKVPVYKQSVQEAMLVEGTTFIDTYHPYYEWVE